MGWLASNRPHSTSLEQYRTTHFIIARTTHLDLEHIPLSGEIQSSVAMQNG